MQIETIKRSDFNYMPVYPNLDIYTGNRSTYRMEIGKSLITNSECRVSTYVEVNGYLILVRNRIGSVGYLGINDLDQLVKIITNEAEKVKKYFNVESYSTLELSSDSIYKIDDSI